MNAFSSTESRALELLGSGVASSVVATALGVTQARISQLLSDEEFSKKVTELKFKNLQKHNARDSSYDEVEDDLLDRFKEMSPLITRPMEILKALQIINSQKRRGHSSPDAIHTSQPVVNLTIPVQVVNRFTRDINNQVIEAGSQTLLTIQSSKVQELSQKRERTQHHGSSESERIETRGRPSVDPIHNL